MDKVKVPYLKIWYTEFCLRRAMPFACRTGWLMGREGRNLKGEEYVRFNELLLEKGDLEACTKLLGKPVSKELAHMSRGMHKWSTRAQKYWDEIVDFV